MPKISIIILTYNSIKFIKSCLDSIFTQDFSQLEIIIVDNNSSDGTVDFIKKSYSQVNLIENKINLGAAKARNQGIEISTGDWILTLDCDVVLERNFLANIAETVNNLPPNVGIIQPKILKSDRKTIYSKGIFISSFRRFYDIDQGIIDDGDLENSYIFGACCASAIYRRKMLEELKEDSGYFDDRFFFLVEDVDIAWRANKLGWKSILIPKLACYHSGNSSVFGKEIRQYLCFRNRYYSISKNEGLKNYFKKIFPFILYDFPRIFYLAFTNRYFKQKISNRYRSDDSIN